MKALITVLAVSALAVLAAPPANAQAAAKDQAAQPAKSPSTQSDERIGDPFPLATCPISGGKLGSMGAPIIKTYDGREVRFCCKSCPPKFEKDLAKSLGTLDAAIIKDQAPHYPLSTSVVGGAPLPEKPLDFVYGNRLVRVASEEEKSQFLKEPAKYLSDLDKAVVDAQGKDYPLKKCPVSGEELGAMGKPVDVVIAGRLVRLCCKSCKKDLMNEPAKFLAAVDAANDGVAKQKKPSGHK